MSHHRWGLSAPNVIPKNFGEGDGPLRRTRTQIRAWIQRDARRVFRDLTRHRSGFPPGRRQGGHPRFYTRVPVRFYPSWFFSLPERYFPDRCYQRRLPFTEWALPDAANLVRNRCPGFLSRRSTRLRIRRGADLRLPLAHRAGR